MLHEVATRLRARTDELAEVMTLEGGKPLVENSDEVGWTAACFDYYAEIGRDSAGRVIPSIESSQLSLVVKEPLGVVGCIVPWNYPLLLLAWKMAPALAAGNTLVGKPSELTPLSTLMLAPCFDHLPAGRRQPDRRRPAVGAAIVARRRVDGIAFTGSVATGKKVARACVDRMARVNLEMGGKDPFIVCSDVADRIDVAAKGGAWAAFLNSGQVCTSAERFYVLDDVYDDYLSAFVDYTREPRDRRPDDRATPTSGRWSRPRSARRSPTRSRPRSAPAPRSWWAATARARSAATSSPRRWSPARRPRPTCCARRPSGRSRRWSGCGASTRRSSSPTRRRYGLGANIYTEDFKTILRCMREVKAGTVWFNDPLTDNDAGPFGGFKQSGLGRELGREGLEAFQETKHVHIESEVAPKEWWYPYSRYTGGEPPHGA